MNDLVTGFYVLIMGVIMYFQIGVFFFIGGIYIDSVIGMSIFIEVGFLMVDFNSEQFVFILVVILDLEIGQFLVIGIEYDGDICVDR